MISVRNDTHHQKEGKHEFFLGSKYRLVFIEIVFYLNYSYLPKWQLKLNAQFQLVFPISSLPSYVIVESTENEPGY